MSVLVLALACARPDGPADRQPPPQTTSTPTPTPPSTTPTTPPVLEPCEWTDQEHLSVTEECPSYVARDDVWVARLVVEAGVVVEVAEGVRITSAGDTLVRGTSTDPVVFRAIDAAAPWSGLSVGSGDQASRAIRGAQIRDVEGTALTTTDEVNYLADGRPFDLVLEDVSIHHASGPGIEGGMTIEAVTPVGFEDVGGTLVIDRTSVGSLATDLVRDLGGNGDPVIEARYLPETTVSQSVPIRLPYGAVAGAVYDYQGGFERGVRVVEPNELRFGAGYGLSALGGALVIDGCVLVPDVPGTSWSGITARRASGLEPLLTLTDSTLTGAADRGVEWDTDVGEPVITGTTIEGVVAAPGEDVCVITCADLLLPALGNTFDCSIPVRCDAP